MAKFTLMLKDPDGVSSSLEDAGIVDNSMVTIDGMEDARALVDKYVEFNEYLYVEFDTEAGTATLVEAD